MVPSTQQHTVHTHAIVCSLAPRNAIRVMEHDMDYGVKIMVHGQVLVSCGKGIGVL